MAREQRVRRQRRRMAVCTCNVTLYPPTLPALQAHPAMRRLMLPALQADFQLVETWRPQAGTDSGCGCAPLCGPRPGSAARRSSSDGSSSAARRSSSGGSSSQEGSGSAPGSAARRSSSQEGGGGDGAAAHTAPGSGQPLDGADLDACLHAHPLALPCPLAAIGATQDSRYTRQQLGAWAACAPPGRYEELWLEGGHKWVEGPRMGVCCVEVEGRQVGSVIITAACTACAASTACRNALH